MLNITKMELVEGYDPTHLHADIQNMESTSGWRWFERLILKDIEKSKSKFNVEITPGDMTQLVGHNRRISRVKVLEEVLDWVQDAKKECINLQK